MQRLQYLQAGLALAVLALHADAQSAGNWTRQIPNTFPPSGGLLYFDTANNQARLYRGQNDLWIWDGTNWKQQVLANSPQPNRVNYLVVYDTARHQLVLFGGGFGDTTYNDTWVLDGVTWSKKSPANSPPSRYSYSAAYDALRGQVVLFGGGSGSGTNGNVVVTYADTWVWDGSNWTQKSPASSPAARVSASMTFDSARGEILFFGGTAPQTVHSTFNDTWTWNGANWTQKSPSTQPSARTDAGLSFDAAHSQTILFSGILDIFGNAPGDTWAWDGSNWSQQKPQNSPSPRAAPMTYDAAHSNIVLFGSYPSGLQDTWIWSGGASSQPSISAVINASAYGGAASVSPGSWVEIYGSALATTTRQWGSADFAGNSAPTSLDGVQVTIGGQKAYVDYVSTTGQVNAQLPSTIPTGGPLPVVVTSGSNASSAFNVNVQATSPGLLAPAAFKINGNQYLGALLPDGVTYILPPGAIQGVASRQVHPAETIITYGIGFGAVNPPIDAGQIVTQQNQLAAAFQIQFGQTAAQVSYSGLVPGFVGLYQFNIVVPAVPDNDLTPVTFTLGGVPGVQKLFVAVHQ